MLSFKQFRKIINKNCIFISPHFDDFIFSCSTLASKLQGDGYRINVVNLFTKGTSPPYPKDTLWLLRKCGFKNANDYFLAREKEDKSALSSLGLTSLNLNFIEGPFRLNVSFDKLFLPNPKQEFSLYKSLRRKVTNVMNRLFNKQKVTIFLPLGIGNHIDHLLVNNSLSELPNNIIYYEDIPYSINREKKELFFHANPEYVMIYNVHASNNKENLAREYKTQFFSLFPNNIFPRHEELFWIK